MAAGSVEVARSSVANRILAEMEDLVNRSEEIYSTVNQRVLRYSCNNPPPPSDKKAEDVMSYPEYFEILRQGMTRLRSNLDSINHVITQSEL